MTFLRNASASHSKASHLLLYFAQPVYLSLFDALLSDRL